MRSGGGGGAVGECVVHGPAVALPAGAGPLGVGVPEALAVSIALGDGEERSAQRRSCQRAASGARRGTSCQRAAPRTCR